MTENSISDLINKRFGDGASFLLGSSQISSIPVIPTGSFQLDEALGIGGLPLGRIVEIYGPESSGKTTLCLHIIAEAQKLGGICAFVDTENAIDPSWAVKCGVNINTLTVSQPDSGENALEIVELYVRSKRVNLVIVDSVARLTPRAEIEGDMGDSHIGLQARLMSQGMRKLSEPVKTNRCCVVFTNQIRHKIGVMFGSPETTTGGNALKFYASIRLDLRRRENIKDKDEILGNTVKVSVKKNKLAPPFRVCEFSIRYNLGIDKLEDILTYGEKFNIIEKGGAWYTFRDFKIQGKESFRQKLMESPNLIYELENEIRQKLRLPMVRNE